MAGKTRRSRKEILTAEIEKIDFKISELTDKISSLTEQKNQIQEEIKEIEAAALKAEEEAKTKEILNLINQKGLTLDEIKELLENHNK